MKKTKQTEEKKTMVSFLLDETGSMSSVRDATISGFNEYIKSLKAQKGEIKFTLTKFNSEKVEIILLNEDIKKVPEIDSHTYKPNALTPLYDAIGKTIYAMDKEVNKNFKVLFVIMTDGQENHSKEYDQKKIFDIIKEKEKVGWTFIYLGADQDSYAEAQKFGLAAGNIKNFDKNNVRQTMSCLGEASASFHTIGSSSTTNFFRDHYTNGSTKRV
jgi:uncharacterized protein YegL